MIKHAFVALLLLSGCRSSNVTEPAASIDDFRARLERLRSESHIRSISAVISKGHAIVWHQTFGGDASLADTTVFHLASLTKPFASTVVLQLVDEGKVSLDDPVSKYGITIASPGTILVRHLLSHTSEGMPGSRYAYNGDRFSLLDSVISRASGKPFAAAVQERIITPLGLRHTAPTPQSAAFAASGLDKARYLLNVTEYKGLRVIWHYGYWTASSTLVIKVPSLALTLVLLANTDGLSSPYPLASGRLDTSPWAREFLETFAIGGLKLP